MFSTIKKFQNARWFHRHLYAYGNLLKRRRNIKSGRKFLYNAELFFDARCIFQCPHCPVSKFQAQPAAGQSMTLDRITSVADKLKSMDCFLCCLVGGEPTLRKDLFDIISLFHERKILPSLITNGYLIDRAYIKQLKKAGLFNIGFSLNGSTAASHDNFVRKEGAFEKVMQAIQLARAEGICVSIALVPTHDSISSGEYRQLVEFAVAANIRVNVNYPALCGEFTGSYDELLTEEELREVRQYFKLPNVTSDFTVLAKKYECPAGRKKIYILPDGNVCPCTFIHISFGNILQEPLEDIMERIWTTGVFMSRPKCCLAGESIQFNREYLEPVFASDTVPLYYTDHPMLSAAVRRPVAAAVE